MAFKVHDLTLRWLLPNQPGEKKRRSTAQPDFVSLHLNSSESQNRIENTSSHYKARPWIDIFTYLSLDFLPEKSRS